jgi:WD40 repeat protein
MGTAGGRTDVIDLRNGTRIETIESGPTFAEPVAFNREGSGLWMKSVDGDRIQEWIPSETTARQTVAWHFPQNSDQELWDGPEHWLIGRETGGKLRAFAEVLGRTSDVRWDTPDVRNYSGAISPRLGYFAMSQEPGVVNVWRLSGIAQGESPTLQATLGGAIMSYHGVTFTGDDRRMAAGSGGSQLVTIWDTESFEAVLTLSGRGWGAQGIAFSPDGNTLACEGAALHIWIAPSWEEIAVAEARNHAEGRQP